MAGYKLYVHPYCISSYKVIKYLLKRNILNKLTIVSLVNGDTLFLEKIVPSVPALEINNKIVAIDPLEPEFIGRIISKMDISTYIPLNSEQIIKRFLDSILASSYLVIHLYFGRISLRNIINSSFTEYALRIYFSNLDLKRIKEVLLDRIDYIQSKISDIIPNIVAINYLRDLLIVNGFKVNRDEAISIEKIRLWSLAKNSIGRSFTLLLDHVVKNNMKYFTVLDILRRKFDVYYDKIIDEYNMIRGDENVYKILTYGYNIRKAGD